MAKQLFKEKYLAGIKSLLKAHLWQITWQLSHHRMTRMKKTKILHALPVFSCTWAYRENMTGFTFSAEGSIRGKERFISYNSDLHTESDSTSWRIYNIE